MKRKLDGIDSPNKQSRSMNASSTLVPYLHSLLLKSNQNFKIDNINFIILQCELSLNRKIIKSPNWILPIERINNDTIMFPPELSEEELSSAELNTDIINEWLLSDFINLEYNGKYIITFSLYPINIAPPKIIETFYYDTAYTSLKRSKNIIQKYFQIEGSIDSHELLVASINSQVILSFPSKRFKSDLKCI